MGAEGERRGWRVLQSGAGGALACIGLFLCGEMFWSLLLALELAPFPWWDQAVIVGIVAAVGGVVAAAARWRGGCVADLVEEAANIVIRHSLFFILLIYSVSKLAGAQFRLPYSALDVPLGDARGYALAWRFFGYSYCYEVFLAAGQLLGAGFLLYWRTTTLGACILLAVLANIVVVNFTHDLPVKLASTCYLLMAAFLIVPDLRRLSALFLENRPFGARRAAAGVGWPRSPRLLVAVKVLFVAVSVVHAVAYVRLGDSRATPISGAWTVDRDANRPAGTYDWRVIYFERAIGRGETAPGSVRFGNDRAPIRFRYEIEPGGRGLRMEFPVEQRANNFVGTYELAADGSCLLRGTRGSEEVRVKLIRKRP